MKELNFTETQKQVLITKLTKLHNQALKFISDMKNGETEKRCSKKELKEFENLTSQLKEYIEDIKYGTKPYTTYEEWCELLADTILDDDNFYIEEDGFSWH